MSGVSRQLVSASSFPFIFARRRRRELAAGHGRILTDRVSRESACSSRGSPGDETLGGGGDRGEFMINVRDVRFDIKPDTASRRQFYRLTREHNAYLIHTLS